MSKIYVGQFLRLVIDTKIDLTDATAVKISYKSPSGTAGEWTATKDPANKTKMTYDISAISEAGTWSIYGKATFQQGTIPGDLVKFTVEHAHQ